MIKKVQNTLIHLKQYCTKSKILYGMNFAKTDIIKKTIVTWLRVIWM